MSTFASVLATRRPAAAIVVLQPSAWHADWKNAPRVDEAIGLRLLSEAETMTASAQAAKEACEQGRTGEVALHWYNEALLCWALGYAVCDPNDATRPYFEMGDSDVRRAFTPATIRHLWDELEKAVAAASPVTPQASDETLADLGMLLLADNPLAGLSPAQEVRARKWLGFVAAQLVAADGEG